jgi:hypothetical protein
LVTPAQSAEPGTSGYAVLEFKPQSVWANQLGTWQPVETMYIKNNNSWQQIKAIYVNINSQWQVVVADNALAPNPTSTGSDNFGSEPRPYG